MPEPVEIVEVGPRDGLQNEKRVIATEDKIALIDLLSTAGFARIEAASFVSPKWVPQMADGGAVMAGISRADGVRYMALTPNMQGFERALTAQVDQVAIFAAASEGFSRANINATIDESLTRFAPVMSAARDHGIPVRAYVSCVTDCPYDGPVAPGAVADVATRLLDLGAVEISLGETLGHGTSEAVDAMLTAVTKRVPADLLAGHFHDTGGVALANIDVALSHGVRIFDAAVGGLGGCPYAKGAKGNVATERVMRHLEAAGYTTGLRPDVVDQAAEMARAMRGKDSE
ncbi:hydroxymethylglutaryl-CoA lyase [Rhodovulum sp. FJ3]|uniref:hydroxymethylglutaryl-CoA lyase n=1 Tax=Rhodovulum sp. FJ3 TaxID=3079053 RepID=UPI00293DD735|nr:hydroxymethylglutaryl-CoA lyase [Rhodovulum sp. FJ3]MDV4167703.1 hydroxymethylglutaryl-CoA lyase [Rhodovulum sp. FJ3]